MELGAVAALFFTAELLVALGCGFFVFARGLRGRFRWADLASALVLVVLAGVLRWPHEGSRFLGNEYEDSYEYIAASWLVPKIDTVNQLAFNQVCALGAAIDCQLHSTTGHPSGFAAVVWTGSAIAPALSRERMASLVSFSAATLTIPTIFFLAVALGWGRAAGLFGGFALASMPLAIVYSSVPTPEAVATLLSTVLVGTWLLSVHSGEPHRAASTLGWFAIALLGFGAALLRRDNLVLTLALPLGSFLSAAVVVNHLQLRRALISSLPLVVAAVVVAIVLDPESAGMGSLSEHTSRFSVGRIAALAPSFLGPLVQLKWTLLLPLVGFLGFLRRDLVAASAPLWVVFAGYIVLFSAFDQDYYYVNTGRLSEAHVLRYLTQALPVVGLLAGVGFSALQPSIAVSNLLGIRGYAALVAFSSCAVAGSALSISTSIRAERSSEEHTQRLDRAARTLDSVARSSVVISAEPLVLQVASNGMQATADFRMIGDQLTIIEVPHPNAAGIYFLQQEECDGIDLERFRSQCAEIDRNLRFRSRMAVGSPGQKWELWQVEGRSVAPGS